MNAIQDLGLRLAQWLTAISIFVIDNHTRLITVSVPVVLSLCSRVVYFFISSKYRGIIHMPTTLKL